MEIENEERALPFKEKWMIEIKKQKDLIKGGGWKEAMIHLRQNYTNEKRGGELNVFKNKRFLHIESCAFKCRGKKPFFFYF